MSIVPLNDVLAFLELTADDSFGNVARLHEYVEDYAKTYTGREWEQASYREQIVDNETESLFLRERPVTKISRLALGDQCAINVRNTNTSGTATVSVDVTNVILTVNGSDTELAKGTYTTIGDMATAINGEAGWTATARFETYLSTDLVDRFGSDAREESVDLNIPNDGISDYRINSSTGEVQGQFHAVRQERFDSEFIEQRGCYCPRIYVDYTGGYTSSNMPKRLQWAIQLIIKAMYAKLTNDEVALKAYSIAGFSKTFVDWPLEAREILTMHRSIII